MEKLDFKAAMKSLKASRQEKSDPDKKFIRKADLIKEKIEQEQAKGQEKSLLRKFETEHDEEEREKWTKMRNVQLNKERGKDTGEKKEEKEGENKNEDSVEIETVINNIENGAVQIPDKFEVKVNQKEWVVTVDPKEAIKEKKDHNEVRREIDVNKYTPDFKCRELYNWFHLMFQEWERELDTLPLDSKENSEGREKLGIYKQCRGYMKPLLRLLKHNEISKEIMNKLFEVMVFCLDKDFIRAHDKYIELAIGNAPWPMGVTMVGIHERSGRSRIYTSQVAHILNDENTKKYLQSVKRIMTLVQRINKASPSNSVVS